jgi:hypothetical protein
MKKSSTKLESLDKKPVDIDEMMKSLKRVGANVRQIVQLNSEEELLVAGLMASLRRAPRQMFSISVSTSNLPFRTGAFTQAQMDATGHLILTSEDGNLEVLDLSETRNRDIMMAVVGEFVPRFKELASQFGKEKRRKPSKVKKTPPPPEPVKPTPVVEEVPVELPEVVEAPSVQEEVPVEVPSPEVEPVPEEAPVLSVDEKSQIDQITAETLTDLETLGDEVFTQSPVSVYFDDWLVHIKQVILGFESSDVITVDDVFTDECEQIFRDIEEELANRLLKEAELEASTKTLADKKNVLGKMDDEYASQATYYKVRGKSAIDFLIKNVQRLEEELEKLEQIKTLNPIKRITIKQKRNNVTQKLRAAKRRVALTMQKSAGEQEKLEMMDDEQATQTSDLEVDKSSMDELIKEIQQLEEKLAKIQKKKTLNPIKRIAQEQELSEVTEKLDIAKQKLALAAQKSEIEQKRIQEEYEQKKKTTINNVQNLEKEIETKKVDNSLEARKATTKALANAVKSLIQRNNEPKSPT